VHRCEGLRSAPGSFGLITSAQRRGSGCREQAVDQARAPTLRDMKGGLGAQHRGLSDASQSAVWLAIASSFIQSLVSSRRASPQVGQPAYTEAVGDLV
jgi:hypothetical protein